MSYLIKRLKKLYLFWLYGFTLILSSCTKEEVVGFEPEIDIDTDPVTVSIPALIKPSEIQGVKWRQNADEEFLQSTVNWWLDKPPQTSKSQVLKGIERQANSVIIRVDRKDRFKSPQETNHDKAMDEIVDAIQKAKDDNNKLQVYLWARIWLERDGNPNYGNIDNGANAVLNWFRPILDKAKNKGVLDMVHGISLIEVNCDRIEDVKEYAKRIADKFNAESNWSSGDKTFFRTRSLLMPGAGFGMDFRNVSKDDGDFLKVMQGRVKYFGFVYKYMRAAHETVTYDDYYNVTINNTKRTWDDMETNASSFTEEERKEFLSSFGLRELTDYIKIYKNEYPTTSHIVFWGDKWDGISKIPPRSRRALHDLLLQGNENSTISTNRGYFFNLAASNTTNSAAQKFYLLDGNLMINKVTGLSGISIGDEWKNWSTVEPDY